MTASSNASKNKGLLKTHFSPLTAMPFSTADIADAVAQGLRQRAAADDAAQVVYGFDGQSELALHPLLHEALRDSGFHVLPEQRYPADWLKPARSEGKRCDIVLTRDPLPMRDPLIRGTLFDDQPASDIEDAYFLEVKTVAQFEAEGPFPRYSAELLSTVTKDISKLHRDAHLIHCGLLLVLFTADEATAEHDLQAWIERAWSKKYPVQPPARRGFAITDRVGNGWCEVAVFAVKGGR